MSDQDERDFDAEKGVLLSRLALGWILDGIHGEQRYSLSGEAYVARMGEIADAESAVSSSPRPGEK